MDIDQIRTFLAVYETGNFNRAAARLNVTQSTVSARIRALEDALGRAVFRRSRAGTQATPEGRRFHPHAVSLLRVWRQARQELSLPEAMSDVLNVGTRLNLWDDLLATWLPWMRRAIPELAVRVDAAEPETLMVLLRDGTLDLAVMYRPRSTPGLAVKHLMTDPLVLVGHTPDAPGPAGADYVMVDWGASFRGEHAAAFPHAPMPALTVSHAVLGLNYVRENGGSGYFPERMVRGDVADGRLHRLNGAPVFSLPVYVVYAEARPGADPRFARALDGLKTAAAGEG